jgi:ubiquitin carboxyl-terminal hydrolase 8
MFLYLSPHLQQQLSPYYNKESQTGPQVKPIQKYDLYAISNHYGGLNGGHYTAAVRQTARKAWYNFDDSRVTEICATGDTDAENAKVKTKAAYSLFYVSRAAM